MSNTVNYDNGVVEITNIDSDWVWTDIFPEAINGISVDFIAFTYGSDGDKCSIKSVNATGPNIFPPQCGKFQGLPQVVYYYGKTIKPFLDYSDGVFTGNHSLVIKLS